MWKVLLMMSAGLCMAQKPLIVAHRGASKDAPENTLPAFNLAWERGADAIEGDFYLTKDNRIVCIHDATTKRISVKDLAVKNSTFDELRKLDAGSWKAEKFKGTVIPSIAEVFEIIPDGKGIYIEVKCGPKIVPNLIKEIKNSGLKAGQVTIISFQKDVIREMKRVAPQYKANWLCSVKKDDQGKISPTLVQSLQTLKEINADGFSSSLNNLSENYRKGVIAAGYDWHVWTVDNPAVAERCIKQGAKSITTNVPGLLVKSGM